MFAITNELDLFQAAKVRKIKKRSIFIRTKPADQEL